MSKGSAFSQFHTDKDGNPTGGHTIFPGGSTLFWQDGRLKGEEQNGAFVEDVIKAAIDRLSFFEASKFKCDENARAIEHLKEALKALNERTAKRTEQGVEDSYDTHES